MLRKFFVSLLSFMLLLSIGITSSGVSSIGLQPIETVTTGKIDADLLSHMETASANTKIPIAIWFNDIDHDSIISQTEKNTSLNADKILCENIDISSNASILNAITSNTQSLEVKEYLEATEEQRATERLETETFIGEKRRLTRAAYNVNNAAFIQNAGIQDVDFVSQYSPMAIANATVAEIKALVSSEDVMAIYLHDDMPFQDELDASIPTIRADYTRNTVGLTGYGVKIGQIEPGVPDKTQAELINSDITTLNDATTPHATQVAAIMVGTNGMAPDAQLFSISCDSMLYLYSCVENLLTYNVSVINMSTGVVTQRYDNLCYYVDFIVSNQNVSVVKSAGNGGSEGDITSPGNAYNCITVGGIADNGTAALSDNYLYSSTSRKHLTAVKPEIYAPAVSITAGGSTVSGTSFATPHVTGLIAQLIEVFPFIATNPRLIKAMILVGGHDFTSTSTFVNSGLVTSTYCAGLVDAYSSYRCIGFYNRYFTGTLTGNTYSHQITIGEGWNYVKIALVWEKNVSTFNLSSFPFNESASTYTNIDLELYDSLGNIVAYSRENKGTFELIYLNAPESGTYTIKVIKNTSSSTAERFAVTWW